MTYGTNNPVLLADSVIHVQNLLGRLHVVNTNHLRALQRTQSTRHVPPARSQSYRCRAHHAVRRVRHARDLADEALARGSNLNMKQASHAH